MTTNPVVAPRLPPLATARFPLALTVSTVEVNVPVLPTFSVPAFRVVSGVVTVLLNVAPPAWLMTMLVPVTVIGPPPKV